MATDVLDVIRTKRDDFTDYQLHVEFATPIEVKGNSQGRGNSGVFLNGTFEIQVLDSYRNVTYPDGQAAAMYGQHPPLVNASRPPGEWQSYDIVFTSPRFGAGGGLARPAIVTATRAWASDSAGMVSRSRSITAISASLPGVRLPSSCSRKRA